VGFLKEWTTGHPKVDPITGEMLLYHCTFVRPYIHYSVIPANYDCNSVNQNPARLMNVPISGISGPKLMHDFGVSRNYTIIMDLPLSLDPLNLVKGRPVVSFNPDKTSRFGVFPRKDPCRVTWFEASPCCIFHTANTWDKEDEDGKICAVNMLVCRLTSATVIFNAGNIMPPSPTSRHCQNDSFEP
jgi:carotenoid cleavage dioxygenase-like enzyme